MSIPEPHLEYEYALRSEGYVRIAGVDEAGRGALAGPVMAGAVILPLERVDLTAALAGVRDSKLCSPLEREELYEAIRTVAVAAAAGSASEAEIDRMGIAAASRLAMRRAVESLVTLPDALLIDWVRLKETGLPQLSFPKGDRLSLSIAAASIVAKVTRDRLMVALDAQYPGYGFAQHKGYCTSQHEALIARLGPCEAHRRSFDPIRTRLIGD